MAKPFTKGDSRINRKGRPRKGKSLTELLEKELAKKRQGGDTGKQALASAIVSLAVGDRYFPAIKYVYDRVDGRPRETIALENAETEKKLLEVLQ